MDVLPAADAAVRRTLRYDADESTPASGVASRRVAAIRLGSDWMQTLDARSGRPYFCNVRTREASWERPADVPLPAPADVAALRAAAAAAADADAASSLLGTTPLGSASPAAPRIIPRRAALPSATKPWEAYAAAAASRFSRGETEARRAPALEAAADGGDAPGARIAAGAAEALRSPSAARSVASYRRRVAASARNASEPEPPAAWREATCPATGRRYWFDPATRATSWTAPGASAPRAPPPPPPPEARAKPIREALESARAIPIREASESARAIPILEASESARAIPIREASESARAIPIREASESARAKPIFVLLAPAAPRPPPRTPRSARRDAATAPSASLASPPRAESDRRPPWRGPADREATDATRAAGRGEALRAARERFAARGASPAPAREKVKFRASPSPARARANADAVGGNTPNSPAGGVSPHRRRSVYGESVRRRERERREREAARRALEREKPRGAPPAFLSPPPSPELPPAGVSKESNANEPAAVPGGRRPSPGRGTATSRAAAAPFGSGEIAPRRSQTRGAKTQTPPPTASAAAPSDRASQGADGPIARRVQSEGPAARSPRAAATERVKASRAAARARLRGAATNVPGAAAEKEGTAAEKEGTAAEKEGTAAEREGTAGKTKRRASAATRVQAAYRGHLSRRRTTAARRWALVEDAAEVVRSELAEPNPRGGSPSRRGSLEEPSVDPASVFLDPRPGYGGAREEATPFDVRADEADALPAAPKAPPGDSGAALPPSPPFRDGEVDATTAREETGSGDAGAARPAPLSFEAYAETHFSTDAMTARASTAARRSGSRGGCCGGGGKTPSASEDDGDSDADEEGAAPTSSSAAPTSSSAAPTSSSAAPRSTSTFAALARHSKRPIRAALTKAAAAAGESEDAVRMFRAIRTYMGDDADAGGSSKKKRRRKPAAKPANARGSGDKKDAVLGEVVWRPDAAGASMRDEFYCQLLKQLVAHPDPRRELRGWRLMYLVAPTFAPSPELGACVDAVAAEKSATWTEERAMAAFGERRVQTSAERANAEARAGISRVATLVRARLAAALEQGPRGEPPGWADADAAEAAGGRGDPSDAGFDAFEHPARGLALEEIAHLERLAERRDFYARGRARERRSRNPLLSDDAGDADEARAPPADLSPHVLAPADDAPEPRTFAALAARLERALVEKGGSGSRSGLFSRASVAARGEAGAEERSRLRAGKRPEAANAMDPRDAAAALLRWLHGLALPVIPARAYLACVSADASDASSRAFAALVPPLHRRVLTTATRVAARAARADAANGAGLEDAVSDVAAAFAPCLMRPPAAYEGGAGADEEGERAFVKRLIGAALERDARGGEKN